MHDWQYTPGQYSQRSKKALVRLSRTSKIITRTVEMKEQGLKPGTHPLVIVGWQIASRTGRIKRLNPGGGGYLVERWVRGCAAQIGCFFGLSGFAMAPFLFENWFLYRSRFCKMHNFRWICPLVYLQVVKKYLCIPIYIVKSTDWF